MPRDKFERIELLTDTFVAPTEEIRDTTSRKPILFNFRLGYLPRLAPDPPNYRDQELLHRFGRLEELLDTGPTTVWKDEETFAVLSTCQSRYTSEVPYVVICVPEPGAKK